MVMCWWCLFLLKKGILLGGLSRSASLDMITSTTVRRYCLIRTSPGGSNSRCMRRSTQCEGRHPCGQLTLVGWFNGSEYAIMIDDIKYMSGICKRTDE